MSNKKVTGFDYLWLALYAVAGFCFELLVVFIEQAIGININNGTKLQMIIHWTITIIAWVVIGLFIIKIGKKTTNFDIWQETQKKMKLWQIVTIYISIYVLHCGRLFDFIDYSIWTKGV